MVIIFQFFNNHTNALLWDKYFDSFFYKFEMENKCTCYRNIQNNHIMISEKIIYITIRI